MAVAASDWCSLNLEQDLSLTGSVGYGGSLNAQDGQLGSRFLEVENSLPGTEARWPQNTKLPGERRLGLLQI